MVSGTCALPSRYTAVRAYSSGSPLGERRRGKQGSLREPSECHTLTLPSSHLTLKTCPVSKVSTAPGSGIWKTRPGHTVSKKLCQDLSQEQSDSKTHPPASVFHSLHKEALKKSMWNYIRSQEFAYLKLVAETTASAARKKEHTASLCSIKRFYYLWMWRREWIFEYTVNEMKIFLINENWTNWIK